MFLTSLAGLVGCTAQVSGGGTGTNSGVPGAGSSSLGSGGNGSGGDASTSDPTTCIPGVPATSQIPRLKDAAYDAVVRDLLGVTLLSSAGNQPPSSLLTPDSEGSMTDIAWNGYLTAADKIAAEVMAGANKSKFISCDPSEATCLTDTIKAFGRKAFRRPLTDSELASFQRLNNLTPKGTPAEVAEAVLYAFLASPSFILLPELGQDKDAQTNALKLTSYEVATRLSFLLWGTVPDEMLNAAADAGQLTTPEQISAQAERMLTSDKAKAVVTNFHHFYAGIQASSHWVNNVDHDATKYPNWSSAAYAPVMAEMDSFFQDVVLKGGTFKDLFLSNVGFVTKDTAALYGLNPASYGSEPTRVELDASQRPGFLTRAGFLSTFAHFDSSSPILRGAFISGRVLGVNPGTPDPNALKTPIPPGSYTTYRQEIEALTANEPCHSCHGKTINPPGFVLERYNSVGAWQDTDLLGGAIDSTADVVFSATNTKTISTPLQLMTELAALPAVQRHYAEQWVAFASGRAPNSNDACTVEKLSAKLAQTGYPVANLIADYTTADSFRLRTLGN
jgi:hypothetical protein